MPDIYCIHCGEPWDHDELHQQVLPYERAGENFAQYGCGAMNLEPYEQPENCKREVFDQEAADAMKVFVELSEHPGDWAADMDMVR